MGNKAIKTTSQSTEQEHVEGDAPQQSGDDAAPATLVRKGSGFSGFELERNDHLEDLEWPSFEISFQDLVISGVIGSGPHGIVYSARFCDRPVAVKKLDRGLFMDAGASKIEKFQQELSVIESLPSHPNIVSYVGFVSAPLSIVTEKTLGNLGTHLFHRNESTFVLDWRMRLQVAAGVAYGLAHLHKAGITHGNLKINNVLLQHDTTPQGGYVIVAKLDDAGLQSIVTKRSNPAYVSPELMKTGKSDPFSDVYALGVLLYELFAERPAYHDRDMTEVMRKVESDPSFRPALDAAIQSKTELHKSERHFVKLMRRCWDNDPRKRPTAKEVGLLLTELIRMITQADYTPRLELRIFGTLESEGDTPAFSIPQKLYGRDIELQALKDHFSSVNPPRCIVVGGVSGVGKTMFVRRAFAELTNSLNSEQYSFHEGGFERNTSTPYSGVLTAFRSAITTRILDPIQKNPKLLRSWRSTLDSALGRNASLICTVLPLLEPIISKDPNNSSGVSEYVNAVPTEVEERFREAFSSFSRVLTGKKHHLTIFIDNVQWADRQSLKLLKTLILSNSLIIVVLAHRVGDTDAAVTSTTTDPRVSRFFSSLRHSVQVHTIRLVPPSINDMAQLCYDALKSVSVDAVFPLAQLIYGRTGGNPFYFHQFLSLLYEQHMFEWDSVTESWKWNIDKIQRLPFSISDDLLGILLSKLNQISVRQQQILKLASCFGTTFTFDALALACESIDLDNDSRIGRLSIHDINECVEHNLLVPYSYPSSSYHTNVPVSTTQSRSRGSMSATATTTAIMLYSFVHDRVHEAIHSLWKDWDAKYAVRVRKQIGYILKQLYLTVSLSEPDTSVNLVPDAIERVPNILFHIVSHINCGRLLISSRHELIELVQLNLRAAERAQAFSDFTKALEFVRIGIEILFERVSLYTIPHTTDWSDAPLTAPSRSRIWDDESCVPIALQLLLMAQRLEYWFGTEKAGDRFFNEIRTFSRNLIISCHAYATKALQLEMNNKFGAAFSLLQSCIEENFVSSSNYSMSSATQEEVTTLYNRIKDVLNHRNFRQIQEAHCITPQEHQGSPLLIIFLAMSTCGAFILSPLHQMYNLCKAMELVLDEVESRVAALSDSRGASCSAPDDPNPLSPYGARIPAAMLTVFLRFAFSTVWRFGDFEFSIKITKACMAHPVTSRMPDFVINYFTHICYWAEPNTNIFRSFIDISLPLAINSASRAYIAYHAAVFPSSTFQSNESISSILKITDNLNEFLLSQNLPTHTPNLKPIHALALLQHIDPKREASFFETLRLVQSRTLPYISFTGTEFLCSVIWTFLNGTPDGRFPSDIALRCSSRLVETMNWEKLIELTSLSIAGGKLTIFPATIFARHYCLNVIARARVVALSQNPQVRNEHVPTIEGYLEQLERLTTRMGFHASTFYHFALAEVERALNIDAHSDEIIPHYEAAIEFARKGQFLLHGALAAESLSSFLMERNAPAERTRRYLLMAKDLYFRLGAEEKVTQLSGSPLLTAEASERQEQSSLSWMGPEESRVVRPVVSDPNLFPFWALDEAERNEQFRRRLERHFAEECRIECLMFLVKTREYSKSSDSKRKSAILADITSLFIGDQAPLEIIYFSPEFRARLGTVLQSERDTESQLLKDTLFEAVRAVSTCTAASFRRLYHSPVISSFLRSS